MNPFALLSHIERNHEPEEGVALDDLDSDELRTLHQHLHYAHRADHDHGEENR